MKRFLLFVLAATPAFAQQGTRIAPACGLKQTTFDVQESPSPVLERPEPGSAQVVFIQDDGPGGVHQHYTIAIGMDGNWVGAYKQNGYFVLNVAPGEHHVCANVQSKLPDGQIVALAHFRAEPGKVYYYRTRFLGGLTTQYPTYPYLILEVPDSDEAKFLIDSSPVSTAVPRK